jgi:glycine/D-amino acid oxidase-like deaminating enzyme
MAVLPDIEKSYWREAYPTSIYPRLEDDLEVDVAIVGAGITGLSCGYMLKQAGFKVAVLEKRTVGAGTTGRTTGKVTSQHSLIYEELTNQLGLKGARLYGEAAQTAVERVEAIVRKEKINCAWQREDNYVFTDDPNQVEKFKAEAKAAAKAGLPASFETKLPLPFNVSGAVKFANQGRFHSQKYLLGLAKATNDDGSYVFENTHVMGIRDGNPGRVATRQAAVTAKHIIVATNVPTLPLMARGGYCILEYPTESYIVAGKIDVKIPGMYISPDKNHYSILPVEHKGQKLLLIGGGGHLSGLRISKDSHYHKLADYAEKYFGIHTLQYKWSDRDYMAYDRVPLIGKLYPWSNNLYVATAYKKWGLTSGTVAGMLLTDIISGTTNPWAPIFTPQRLRPVLSIPKAVARYITGNNG